MSVHNCLSSHDFSHTSNWQRAPGEPPTLNGGRKRAIFFDKELNLYFPLSDHWPKIQDTYWFVQVITHWSVPWRKIKNFGNNIVLKVSKRPLKILVNALSYGRQGNLKRSPSLNCLSTNCCQRCLFVCFPEQPDSFLQSWLTLFVIALCRPPQLV